MEVDREELLRQKALIEEQLRWIESKLAQPDDEVKPRNTSGGDESIRPVSIEKQPLTPEATTQKSEATPATPLLTSPVGGSFTDNKADGTLSGREKIGCALIAIAICVGILVALFALPYLIY